MNLTPIKANMTELSINGLTILFSYQTPVAYIDHNVSIVYTTNKYWSKTTSRHINQWISLHDIDEDLIMGVNQDQMNSLVS
jgi:hypothetical protein